MERRELVANVVAVARTARLYGLPIVLSTVNVATGHNQPTIRQLTEVLGGVEPIDRTSINAWENVDFVAAVKATGRHTSGRPGADFPSGRAADDLDSIGVRAPARLGAGGDGRRILRDRLRLHPSLSPSGVAN